MTSFTRSLTIEINYHFRGMDMKPGVVERYLVDADGTKRSVVLAVKDYEKLLDDLHDLAKVAERREEKAIDIDELKRRLKSDGSL